MVKLYKEKDQINIEIADNGIGIDNSKLVEGKTFGLLGMRERANLIGGNLFIKSEPGKGTTIKVVI
jgi:signal transduction histidine kinase